MNMKSGKTIMQSEALFLDVDVAIEMTSHEHTMPLIMNALVRASVTCTAEASTRTKRNLRARECPMQYV